MEDAKITTKMYTYIPLLAAFPLAMTPNPYWYLPLSVVGLLFSVRYFLHSINASPLTRSVHFGIIAEWMGVVIHNEMREMVH